MQAPRLLRTFALVLASCIALPTAGQGDPDDPSFSGYISWISDYDPGTGRADKPGCVPSGNGAANELSQDDWFVSGPFAGINAAENHWRDFDYRVGGLDDLTTDQDDILYFCGHGGKEMDHGWAWFWPEGGVDGRLKPWETNGPEMNHAYGGFGEYETVEPDMDAEWIVFDTGHTLDDDPQIWSDWYNHAFSKLHVLLGWENAPLDNDHGGEFFDSLFDWGDGDGGGRPIWEAWNEPVGGGCDGQPAGKIQVAIYERVFFLEDHMYGEGVTYLDVTRTSGTVAVHVC